MTTDKSNDPQPRVNRAARLRWVHIVKMRVSSQAQRAINKARVNYLAANFDLEQIGSPTVSERDGHFWIIDGQHRIEALRQIGWGDQQIQCWTYTDLTEEEEGERFLKLNNVLRVDTFEKFKVGVKAGRAVECDIDRIVRANKLVVSREDVPGRVRPVGTLEKIYNRSDPATLGRTLRIVRDAYGDPGLVGPVLDGIGLLCQRYNGELDDPDAIRKLGNVHGGVNGLLGQAQQLRLSTGNTQAHCVAAAAVEIINRGRRGAARLQSWWRAEA